MKNSYIFLFLILLVGGGCNKEDINIEIKELTPNFSTNKIYGDGSTYCAFTSMVQHNDNWYLAFREGSWHVSEGAVIRILKSHDGISWEYLQTISAGVHDLRDPNLSIMPNGTLLLLCGVRIQMPDGTFSTKTYYTKAEGECFGEISPIILPSSIDDKVCAWLWKLTWHKGIGYGAVYRNNGFENKLTIVKTVDGISYSIITELEVGRVINETRIRFLPDDTAVALIRSDGNGYIGKSSPPYRDWYMKQTNIYMAGQDFIIENNRIICATRKLGKSCDKVAVFIGDLKGTFEKYIELPSGGESGHTSYPSIINKEGYYWISYYSKHETVLPCIYMSKLAICDTY